MNRPTTRHFSICTWGAERNALYQVLQEIAARWEDLEIVQVSYGLSGFSTSGISEYVSVTARKWDASVTDTPTDVRALLNSRGLRRTTLACKPRPERSRGQWHNFQTPGELHAYAADRIAAQERLRAIPTPGNS